MKLISVLAFAINRFAMGSGDCPNDLATCIDMCPADIFKLCLQSCQKRCAPSDTGDFLRHAIGGSQAQGKFALLEPNPDYLIWDTEPNPYTTAYDFSPEALFGWLKVPVRHDDVIRYDEESPFLCLRVVVKPARKQPARLGPILLHCGGPGSGAECAGGYGLARLMELNSSALVGPPLSEDYDYWSISQRGMNQLAVDSVCPFMDADDRDVKIWPQVQCRDKISELAARSGVEAVLELMDGEAGVATWNSTIKHVLDGPAADIFGVPFYNETWVRWFYRTSKLQLHLCYHDDKYSTMTAAGRSYNLLDYMGTENLAYDIETFRKAIGASKMSIYGVSYGTMVSSVYATMFPEKVHRLIIDGHMGLDPEVMSYANWVGESTEAAWTGLSEACDASVMGGGPVEKRCPAAPGATGKLHSILHASAASTTQAQFNAVAAFNAFGELYHPAVPCAYELLNCINNLYLGKNLSESSCVFDTDCQMQDTLPEFQWQQVATKYTQGSFSAVLGNDYAGRFTEQTFMEWWRKTKSEQPLGLTRSLPCSSPAMWPGLPRPQPPVGDTTLTPLIIGNLHDAQTPYHNSQKMRSAFPSGRMLTWQGYGHGLQIPHNVDAIVKQFEEETQDGILPTYSNDVAKLLCVRVALQYLKNGTLPRDYVCKAAVPAMTGPTTTPSLMV